VQQIGPYRVLRELGRGGMGVVFLAEDASGVRVALKLLRGATGPARQRFAREAEALSRLSHPHVVGLRAAGQHEGRPWLALDLVRGESLAERLRTGPLAIHEAQRITQQLAGALSYVHSCGVVHRDLKPENVLLDGGEVRLTDFGLALDEDLERTRLTQTGAFLGTPGYWAPEQALGEKQRVGPATDLYGLGGVLYACLTGVPPVQAKSLHDYLQGARFREVVAPHVLRAEVPAWLSELCMRCLAPEPEQRPPSADAVARALILGAGSAPPAQPARRGGLWVLAGGAALGVALVTVWVGTLPGATDDAEVSDEAGVRDDLDVSDDADPLSDVAASDDPLARAQALLARRRFPQALEAFEAILAEQPGLPAALLGRGRARLRLGGLAEAQADAEAAAASDPAGSCLLLGLIEFDRQRTLEAERYFDRALQHDPELGEAYLVRGITRGARGDIDAAQEDLDRAAAAGADRPELWINRGYVHFQRERYDLAIDDYTRRIAMGSSFTAHYYRGAALLKLGRYAEAVADFERALGCPANDRETCEALTDCAQARIQLGDFQRAVADCERALELDDTQGKTWATRAHAHQLQGNSAAALADASRAVELAPDQSPAWFTRGNAQKGLGRFEAAIDDYSRAIEITPDYGSAFAQRGMCRGRLGRLELALADFDRALELADDPKLHSSRGDALSELKRYRAAVAAYDRSLELLPGRARVHLRRGIARYRLKDLPGAEADFARAAELGSDDAELYVHWARATLEGGDAARALELLDQAEAAGLKPPLDEQVVSMRELGRRLLGE